MSGTQTRRFAPGEFLGDVRLSCLGHGVSVSHRIAEGPPEAVPSHTHEDAHFILVTGGDYVTAAGGHPAEDRPVLIYNPPGTTHRDHFQRGRGSFFAISLSPDHFAVALGGTCVADTALYLAAPAQHAIAMRIAGSCTQPAAGLLLEALSLELLGSMGGKALPEPRSAPAWLRSALELLHDRYDENLTIADIAGSVGIHPVHLARMFRRHFHWTPAEFARWRRLEKALHLLARTSLPLAEVALTSGFADQSHFSKAFARCFGLPPGEYRILAGLDGIPSHKFQIDKTRFSRWAKLTEWAARARASTRKRQ
jgi:AraC family transcriptional regulator